MNPLSSSRDLVLALVAQNANDALRLSSTAFGTTFTTQGYRHEVIDLRDPAGPSLLQARLQEGRVAFAYGFAGIGGGLTLRNGASLWTAARTPYLALWHDHPAYNYGHHLVDSPFTLHVYHVRDHLEARRKALPQAAPNAALVPPPCRLNAWARTRPLAGKKRRVLFVKSGVSPTLWAEDWQRHPAWLQSVLRALADQAQRDRTLDLVDAATILFGQQRQPVDNPDLFLGAVQEVDAWIRAWRSDRLARALLRHDADIVGDGWDYLKGEKGAATFRDAISAEAFQAELFEYRVIANSSPLWRDGIHERALSAITMGALALTDRTEKSDKAFAGLPNYCAFDWQDILEDAIADALRRADQTDADYFEAGDRALAERLGAGREDYLPRLATLAQGLGEGQTQSPLPSSARGS